MLCCICINQAYDILEIKLATSIAINNNKEHYLEGWKNRANDKTWDVKV